MSVAEPIDLEFSDEPKYPANCFDSVCSAFLNHQ